MSSLNILTLERVKLQDWYSWENHFNCSINLSIAGHAWKGLGISCYGSQFKFL